MPQTHRTMCPMNCLPTVCGMLVDIEEGRVTRIHGNPENPESRGFLCMRGHVAAEITITPRASCSRALATRGIRSAGAI